MSLLSRRPIDRAYYRLLTNFAIPIIIQQFIASSLNLVDVVMVGQLGDSAVASVGLANQVSFLLTLMMFGISSGGAAYSAQYWGKKDVKGIRKVLGISLLLSLVPSLLFTTIALAFPGSAMRLFTNDPAVITLGSKFLRLLGFSFSLYTISTCFAATLRSTGNVRLPMATSILAILLKTGLGYVLIFGHFGLPILGVEGAAVATVIARLVECVVLVSASYLTRTPAAAKIHELLNFNIAFLKNYLTIVLPVVFNETLWSLGVSTYNAIYARISTEAIAAVNIASTLEGLAFVIFIGISDACGIMIGNKIGAGDTEAAYRYGKRTLILSTGLAIWMGGGILAASQLVPILYKVSPTSLEYAQRILTVMAFALWIRTSNMTLVVGIMRGGGDTRFCFFLESGTMWLIGVPSAALAAFVFHLPVYWVYLMVLSEEFVKYLIGVARLRSRKWIHDLSACN